MKLSDFDPDAYLAQTAVSQFDPDAYLAQTAPPTSNVVADTARRLASSTGASGGQALAGIGYPAQRAGEIADHQGDSALLLGVLGTLARGVGDYITGAAREGYDIDPKRDDTLPAKLAQGAGTLPVAIASGPAAPLTVAAMMGEAGREDAEETLRRRGISDPAELQRAQDAAFALNAPVGAASEALLGLPKLLKAVRAMGGAASPLGRVARQTVAGAAREGAQEGLEQLAGNVIAADVVGYDPERERTAGVVEATLLGSLVGGPTAGTFQGAQELDARRGHAEFAAGLDTGQNVPESEKTLLLQRDQLLRGLRPAQMFPKGTPEPALPEGIERTETPRGVFHFNPGQITAKKIAALSAEGRENEILGLGPVSKPEAMARAAATGEPLVAVVERAPDGTEVKGAIGTAGTAPAQVAALEASKSPGSTVTVENPERGIVQRLRAQERAKEEKIAADIAKEKAEREKRQLELTAKRLRFDETLAAADRLAADPQADFSKLKGALTSLEAAIEDNSLGLALEQRQAALARVAAIRPRAEALRAEFDAAAEARAAQAKAQEAAKQAAAKAARRAEREALDAIETTGRDPREGGVIVDITKVPDAEFEQLRDNLDAEGLDLPTWEKEMGRRMREQEAGDESAPRFGLLDVFTGANGAKRWIGRTLRLRPASAARADGDPLAGDLAALQESLPFSYFAKDGMSLDRAAEYLRAAGFSDMRTPADVLAALDRASRGEDVRPNAAGVGDVEFAAAARRAVRTTEGITAEQLSRQVLPVTLPDAAPFARRNAENRPAARQAVAAVGDVDNPDLGTLRLSNRRRDHLVADAMGPDGYRVLAVLADVLRNAREVGRPEADNNTGREGVRVRRAVAAVRDGSEVMPVRITFHDTADGLFVHAVSLLRDEKRPAGSKPASDVESSKGITPGVSTLTVADLLPGVKPAAEGAFTAEFAARGSSARPSPSAPRVLSEAEVSRQFAAMRTALGPVARQFDIKVGLVADVLQEEGYATAARMLRAGQLGDIKAATAPRLAERITALRAERRFIVVAAEAARQGQAPGLLIHELAHPFYDAMPEETKRVLRQMHADETDRKTGPLYRDGSLVTDVAIEAAQFPKARLAADPDLPIKEWFAERVRVLNEAWLAGRASADRPLLRRLWDQLMARLREVFAQVRRLDPADRDLFTDTFREWIRTANQANVAPAAAAYAQRQAAQFAAVQSTMDFGGQPVGLYLPATIQNLSPRWQDKTLRFESNLDKALYYAGGTPSAVRDAIIAHVARETGLSRGEIGTLARDLRAKLGPLARSATRAGTLTVPPQMQRDAARKSFRASVGDTLQSVPRYDYLIRDVEFAQGAEGPSPRLPRNLAGTKPRYGFGKKNFELSFASDIDRALYITSQKTKSKSDAAFVAWLREQGLTREQIVEGGRRVRETIKAMARDAEGKRLEVPELFAQGMAAPEGEMDFEAEAEPAPAPEAPEPETPEPTPAAPEAEEAVGDAPALPPGVKTGADLEREQAEEAARLSDAAKDMRHPAAVGDVGPDAAWASVVKLTPEQLAEELGKIDDHLNENAFELADIEKAHLLARRDAVAAEQARRRAAAAQAPKPAEPGQPSAPAIPKPDPETALIDQWRRGRAMRDEGRRLGDIDAEDAGQAMMSRAKQRLDLLSPDWMDRAMPGKAPSGGATPEAGPASRPRQERRPGVLDQDDGRNLPPAPPEEPGETVPPAGDAPPPDRGRARAAFGHTATTPSWWARTWEKARAAVVGFRGSIPELPAFPALAKDSDRFIRSRGPNFYDGLRAFYRTLSGANDYVQRGAEEQVGAIVAPLLRLGGNFPASQYRRLQRLQAEARRAIAEGRNLPPSQGVQLDALHAQLETHPYYLFNRLVYFMDLDWRRRNLKDSEGNPIRLPFGLNETELENELARIGAAIAANPHAEAIEKAYQRHTELVRSVADDLRGRDLLTAEHLANPVYFPHLTLEITRGDETVERELRPERVRVGTEADFRGYLVEPVGSDKAIESDYVRAMYYHLVQVGAHNLKADAIRDHVRPYDVRPEVEKMARQLSKERGVTVSWEQAFHEQFRPAGYVLYGTDSRDAFPSVQVDRSKLAQRLGVILTSDDLQKQLAELGLKGIKLLPEDLRETLVQGQREVWIVPARVAEALRGIADRQNRTDQPIETALRSLNSWWKRWKLFMPQNHVRYEYGNVVADLEKLFSASPRTFRFLGQSAKEMRAFFQGEAPGDDLRAALKLGVINAITAQEIDQLQRLRAFEKFQTAGERVALQLRKRASSALYQPITNALGIGDLSSVELSALREGVTRYANFLANLDAIRNGARPDYAGAYWRDIEAMGDSRPGAGDKAVRQAAQISKATFGDYGDLSVTGQYLRDKFIPFYSWMEVNFRYHANLFRNLRDMVRADIPGGTRGAAGQAARSVAALAAGRTSWLAGKVVLRLALPYVAVSLWNALGPHDVDDDELSEEDRRRFHIRLGHDENGKALVVYGNTAFADVMKWFGGARFADAFGDWIAGRTDFLTAMDAWASELPSDLANNTIGSAGPTVKIPATLLTGRSFFPDVLDSRTIPDFDMRRNILGQVTDEFTADLIERIVNKDYIAAKDLGEWAQQLVLQVRRRDPESWAFYSIKDKAADFLEERTGKSRDTDFNAPDQQVLKNFRRAIYKGDVQEASRAYLRLLELGYTAERFAASVRAQDPLGGLPKDLRDDFVESLDDAGRMQLRRAFAYYTRMSAARGRERSLFPSERWGERGLERYRQNPRLDALESLVETREQLTEEELEARLVREMRRSVGRN